MEQRTNDWHGWRQAGIGSSDAPIIMGVSPYTKLHKLWEQKVGISKGFGGNWATMRGNQMEPKARADYELRYGIEAPPMLVIHSQYDFMRASLDGYNRDLGIVLEIKCPGKKDHTCAEQGQVPVHYYPQIQHQLMVTGAREAHYYSFKDEKGILIKVAPDLEYIKELALKEIKFWYENVLAKVAPSSS